MYLVRCKGYSKKSKKWFVGFLVKHEKVLINPWNVMDYEELKKENTEYYIVYDNFTDWNLPTLMLYDRVDIYRFSTGIFIKEGSVEKEVFEGDTVRFLTKESEELSGKVAFLNNGWVVCLDNGKVENIDILRSANYVKVFEESID